MQKKLIALAVAGLLSGGAFAQANVTISGLARMSAEQYRLSGMTPAFEGSSENRISDQSSMIVFQGRDDIGGGMYSSFTIDARYSPDLGAIAASGNTNIKLGGSWGSVAMGRQDLHYGTALESYKAYTLQNILSNGPFSQVNGTTIANGTRTPNVLWYDSPNWSGFTARVAASTSFALTEGSGVRAAGAADPGKGSATNLALNYANGPWTAGYSYWTATIEGGKTAAAGDQRGDTVQGGYTFPMGFKLGLAWNKSKLSFLASEATRTSWILPISYDFGNHRVNFTYNSASNISGTTNVTNSGAKAYTLAWGYSMSKRTNLGLGYTRLTNDTAGTYNLFAIGANGGTSTAATPGADVSQLSFSMNHAF